MSGRFPADRPNPPDLVPFAEARSTVLARINQLPPRELPLDGLLGCVLAEDVSAREDLPPFVNSAMDGFAVRSSDLRTASPDMPVPLEIAGEVFAGTAALPQVEPGCAVRIMTGGALPPGADAVVPVEQTSAEGRSRVLVRLAVGGGAFIRDAGEDVRAGTTVLRAGHLVDAAAVGMLASVGRASALVHPRPRVAVVSTGDELVDPAETLLPGQIRDSNGPLLAAQARSAGAEAWTAGRVRDDPEALAEAFGAAAKAADLVLTSGGVSVGDHDFTKQVLARLGDVRPWKVAMQPGMPQAFGFLGETPMYGLPGNPVSCFVVFEVLVRPLLRRLAGFGPEHLDRPQVQARLTEPIRSPAGKTSFLRVRLEVRADRLEASLTGPQGSGVLSSCVAADGLAVIGAEVSELPAGAVVGVMLLREDLGWVA